MAAKNTLEIDSMLVEELNRRASSRTGSARQSQRAKLILLYHEGYSKSEITRRVDLSRSRVIDWIARFEAEGLNGLEERKGRGRENHKGTDPL